MHFNQQEQQQREHEDEMRARLRRSESIEKAAVSLFYTYYSVKLSICGFIGGKILVTIRVMFIKQKLLIYFNLVMMHLLTLRRQRH